MSLERNYRTSTERLRLACPSNTVTVSRPHKFKVVHRALEKGKCFHEDPARLFLAAMLTHYTVHILATRVVPPVRWSFPNLSRKEGLISRPQKGSLKEMHRTYNNEAQLLRRHQRCFLVTGLGRRTFGSCFATLARTTFCCCRHSIV